MTTELKSEWYARNFFFALTPNSWSYEQLTDYLRKQEGTFLELEEMETDELCAWEPFEAYNPTWVADQMDMMVEQLSMLYKEVV